MHLKQRIKNGNNNDDDDDDSTTTEYQRLQLKQTGLKSLTCWSFGKVWCDITEVKRTESKSQNKRNENYIK